MNKISDLAMSEARQGVMGFVAGVTERGKE